jgi:hypothetical protein
LQIMAMSQSRIMMLVLESLGLGPVINLPMQPLFNL